MRRRWSDARRIDARSGCQGAVNRFKSKGPFSRALSPFLDFWIRKNHVDDNAIFTYRLQPAVRFSSDLRRGMAQPPTFYPA